VQNFNEQACILGLGALYTGLSSIGLNAFMAITAFGLIVSGFMWLIKRWHTSNQIHHSAELERLLNIARNDNLHG
jgi:hypothetical protein